MRGLAAIPMLLMLALGWRWRPGPQVYRADKALWWVLIILVGGCQSGMALQAMSLP